LGSYRLDKVEKITFDSTSSSAVVLGNTVLQTAGAHNYSTGNALVYGVGDLNNKLSELDVGRTYYAITTAENNKFRLAETEGDAIAGRAISLGTDLAGAHQFTKNSTITTLSVMEAIATNASNRASLGAQLNVLDYAIDNLQTLSNNLSEAYSRIVDTDYAAETAALTRNQILQQAATSMLAQANQMPNVILTLLK
jgi:flagellin-like hook-associated protein FlgL